MSIQLPDNHDVTLKACIHSTWIVSHCLAGLAASHTPSPGRPSSHHLSSIATVASLNETVSATLPVGGNHYYQITLVESGTLTTYTQGTLNTFGQVLNEADKKFAEALDGATANNFLINVHMEPGTYFIRVSSLVPSDSGAYNLVIEFAGDNAPKEDPVTDEETFRATLPREVALISIVSRSDGVDTLSDARFNAGASLTDALLPTNEFDENDDILIAGAVTPLETDRGKAAGIYLVIRTILADGTNIWTYRNSSGAFVPWDGVIATLQPAYEIATLGTEEVVEIFTGKLQVASHRIFLGYRLSTSGPLHYNQVGLRLDVN